MKQILLAVFLVVSCTVSLNVSYADDFNESYYGRSSTYGGYESGSNYDMSQRAQEENRRIEEAYRESNRRYLETPSYDSSASTWIYRPSDHKLSQCVKAPDGSNVITCY